MLAISLPNALGLTLLHALWQAAAIVGVYRLAALLVPDLSPARRYRLGLVALLALIVAPLATFLAILGGVAAAIVPAVSRAVPPAFEAEMLWLVLDGLWATGAGAMLLRTAADGWALRCLGRTTFAPPAAGVAV